MLNGTVKDTLRAFTAKINNVCHDICQRESGFVTKDNFLWRENKIEVNEVLFHTRNNSRQMIWNTFPAPIVIFLFT